MERIEIDTARGQERVPPGQYLVGEDRWPVLTYGPTPGVDISTWDFSITGLVEEPLRFSWEEFNELPRVEVKADMHCVTSWSKLDNVWEGVRARDVLEMARPKPEAHFSWPTATVGTRRTRRRRSFWRGRAVRDAPQRGASGGGARGTDAARHPTPLRLEEREVAQGPGVHRPGSPRLLGAERLPRLRRPLARAALQLQLLAPRR